MDDQISDKETQRELEIRAKVGYNYKKLARNEMLTEFCMKGISMCF
jgi:hypothetical protein